MLFLRARLAIPLIALALALAFQPAAPASVHTYYNVQEQDLNDGFSASWLHAATSGRNGSIENGARLNGVTTSRLDGSFEGDLSGNVLSNITGSVGGDLKQLATYLNGTIGTNFNSSDSFELRLGSSANGGQGALAFEYNGPYTGGFLDFSLFVAGSAVSALDGTFFFKPQAEFGSDALSPNRGTSYSFSLWGSNWMHDGPPVDNSPAPDWASFLGSLGYNGPTVSRPDLSSPLGIALYVVDPPPSVTPEPTGILIWGLLAMVTGLASCRCEIRQARLA